MNRGFNRRGNGIVIDRTYEEWTEQALCRTSDPDLFFPETGGNSKQAKEAMQVCSRCPVIAFCARAALQGMEINGVWAGQNMSLNGRDRILTRQRLTQLSQAVA